MTSSFTQAIAAFEPTLPLAVAYSGGADSTALLLACASKWPKQVQAVHVHHGIQVAGDDFERHCQTFCTKLDIPLVIKKVDGKPAPGQSPEAAARSARYKAFSSLALDYQADKAIKTIAIAQHADDQIETLLLALSRGAGLPGISAMPSQWQSTGLHYCRPLLGVCSSDIRSWLHGRGETFIEDPSNMDKRFTRNRIRAQVVPALNVCFPQFRDTFVRSCAHAAQAQTLLDELAAEDLARLGAPPPIKALQSLSKARMANLMRHWLLVSHQTTPTTAQLHELMDQVTACRTKGHQLHLKIGNGLCIRRGESLHWYNPAVLL